MVLFFGAFLECLFLITICLSTVNSSNSPVIIWSTNELDNLPPSLAGNTISEHDFEDNYLSSLLKPNHNIVVFQQKKLSIEDILNNGDVFNENTRGGSFSNLKALLDTHHTTHYPQVEKPAQALQRLSTKFGSNTFHASDLSEIKQYLTNDSPASLITFDLPDLTDLDSIRNIDSTLREVTETLLKLGKSFSAIYTGKSPNKHVNTDKFTAFTGRHLLSTNSTSSTFLNVTGCLYWYAESIMFDTNKTDFVLPSLSSDQYNKDLTVCNTSSREARLVIDYTNVKQNSSTLDKLRFDFNFSVFNDNSWSLSTIDVSYTLAGSSFQYEFREGRTLQIEAPAAYSYHCSRLDPLTSQNLSATITFKKLQIQYAPTTVGFGPAYDCVGFFSIPIWSGLISSFTLLLIFLFGFLMIFNVKTNDRYDDPKGKTITVNVSE